jgi:hypothetical protein
MRGRGGHKVIDTFSTYLSQKYTKYTRAWYYYTYNQAQPSAVCIELARPVTPTVYIINSFANSQLIKN